MATIKQMNVIRQKCRVWITEYANTLHEGNPPRIEIEFSNRLTRSNGVCKTYTNRFVIGLSVKFLESNIKNEELIKQICGHEVAHTLVSGHGLDFVRVCESIGVYENGKVTISKQNMPKLKYTAICPKCGEVGARGRKPKDGRGYTHSVCGSPVEWIKNY